MPKAYWISFYQQINDPAKYAAYVKLAAPAILAGGGRFLARGVAERAFDAGSKQRVTVVEFESVEAAIATHEGAAYQAALAALADGIIRDLRIVAGE
jgi:uncharacterized protein (DUF1330 family)